MLSSLVVSRQIDPRSHNNKRSEFRIDTKVYLSNPRLIDVCSSYVAAGTIRYPTNVGVDALIKNILVYSGKTLIGDCREWSRYAGYKNAQKSNAHQWSVLPFLKRTRQGTINRYQQGVNGGNAGYGFVREFLRKQTAIDNEVGDADGFRGYVRLGDFVEFFNATPHLSYIPDLRIVIEWNNLTTADLLDDTAEVGVTSYTIGRPTLVLDEIVDEAALAAFKPEMKVQYLNVEYTKQDIAANAAGTQRTAMRPKTYDGKYLKDLVVAVSVNDVNIASTGLARNTAFAFYQEKWRLFVNGANILQQDGIDTPARKMYFNKISRGALARGLFHNNYQNTYIAEVADQDRLQYQESRQAYLTLGVEDLINHLDLDFRRTYTVQSAHTDLAGDAHIFGRVARTFVLQNNKVLTAY